MRFVSRAAILISRPHWRSYENLLRLVVFLAVLVIVGLAIFLRDKIDYDQVGKLMYFDQRGVLKRDVSWLSGAVLLAMGRDDPSSKVMLLDHSIDEYVRLIKAAITSSEDGSQKP